MGEPSLVMTTHPNNEIRSETGLFLINLEIRPCGHRAKAFDQYSPLISPPLMVANFDQTQVSVYFVTNRTLPSPMRTLQPPLPACSAYIFIHISQVAAWGMNHRRIFQIARSRMDVDLWCCHIAKLVDMRHDIVLCWARGGIGDHSHPGTGSHVLISFAEKDRV